MKLSELFLFQKKIILNKSYSEVCAFFKENRFSNIDVSFMSPDHIFLDYNYGYFDEILKVHHAQIMPFDENGDSCSVEFAMQKWQFYTGMIIICLLVSALFSSNTLQSPPFSMEDLILTM